MNEELAQLDADLKGLFSENKLEQMNELLKEQAEAVIIEITKFYCGVIRKYYDGERFDLLFTHIRFVALTCYVVEYAKQSSLLQEEEYQGMMRIYNDVYERRQQQ